MAQVATTIAALLLVLAAGRDIAKRTIPDWISIVFAAGGLAVRASDGAAALCASLAIAAALFIVMTFACLKGAIGGGDVKLISAVALGLAPWQAWNFLTLTALAGGGLAGAYMILSIILPPRPKTPAERAAHPWLRILAAEYRRIRRRAGLPYGVAIAIGGVLVLQAGSSS